MTDLIASSNSLTESRLESYMRHFLNAQSTKHKVQAKCLNMYVSILYYRSKIQGLGLYAARDLEKHTMVIEYIGEVIRSELSELREKQYEAKVN